MELTTYFKPWLSYLVCTLLMCIIYCGLEQASGKIGFTAKCILSSWCIISIIVTVMLFGLQTYISETGSFPPLQISGVTFLLSCLTLSISSCCIHSAK